MTVIRTPIASREAWLEMRASNIGASDIAALFGCHPYRTALGLYAEKTGMVPQEAPASGILERGQIMEASVAAACRLQRPDWRISKCEDYLHAPDWRLGATPDFIVHCPKRGSVGLLQTKVIAMPEFDKHWQEGPPDAYVLQTAQELMLDSHERGNIAGWAAIGVLALSAYSMRCEVYEFDRNIGAEMRILQGAAEFWKAVERGEPPQPNYARDGAVLRAINAKGGGPARDLSRHNRIALLCEEKLAWARRHTIAGNALDVINAEIIDILGDADRGEHPEFNISCKEQWTGGQTIPRKLARVLRVTRKSERSSRTTSVRSEGQEQDHGKRNSA